MENRLSGFQRIITVCVKFLSRFYLEHSVRPWLLYARHAHRGGTYSICPRELLIGRTKDEYNISSPESDTMGKNVLFKVIFGHFISPPVINARKDSH